MVPPDSLHPPPPLYDGLAELAAGYEAFVVDLWGVLHDGVTAFPDAVAALEKLKGQDKRIIILSNAPRRAAAVTARNRELGIDPALADLVMSSGEETWVHLKQRLGTWYQALGRRCYHLGPARDAGIREGLEEKFVEDLADADYLLNTGSLSARHSRADYRDLLSAALTHRLPMVCANPDLVVIRGGAEEICAGTIAQAYEALGGEVRYHGKPDPEIYRRCFAALGLGAETRTLAIGDSLRTDIAGARAAGIDSLFIVAGIHEAALCPAGRFEPTELQRLSAETGIAPDAVMTGLRW